MAPKLEGSREAGLEAAKAIMTTDTEKKEAAVEIEIGGKNRNGRRYVQGAPE